MWGLGKPYRTKFGKWLDRQQIKQSNLEKAANLGRTTVARLCNEKDYKPRFTTIAKINRGLKKLGKEVDANEFF